MRIMFLLPALVVLPAAAAGQQAALHAVPGTAIDAAWMPPDTDGQVPVSPAPFRSEPLTMPVARSAPLSAVGVTELNSGRKLSIAGGVVGAVVGAVVGGAIACVANRDHYGVYCAGQNDTKMVIGVVIGAGVGGWIGAVLLGRRE